MGPHLTSYEAFWGAAGISFALGGARALSREMARAGARAGLALRSAPLLAVFLAFVGARVHALMTSPAAAWRAFAEGTLWEAAGAAGQRIGGGLVLAAAFLVVVAPRASAGRLSGPRLLDALVPLAGAAIAIGRLGCQLAGCCFGIPGDVPWATVYGRGSTAFWNHVAQGRLSADAVTSLAVHPLALYLGACGAVAGAAAWATARRGAPTGAPTLMFLLVVCGSRLVLEPLRETRFLGAVPGQTALDSAFVVVALAGLGALLLRRRRPGAQPRSVSANGVGPSSPGTPRR